MALGFLALHLLAACGGVPMFPAGAGRAGLLMKSPLLEPSPKAPSCPNPGQEENQPPPQGAGLGCFLALAHSGSVLRGHRP